MLRAVRAIAMLNATLTHTSNASVGRTMCDRSDVCYRSCEHHAMLLMRGGGSFSDVVLYYAEHVKKMTSGKLGHREECKAFGHAYGSC